MRPGVQSEGLTELVAALKGPAFRNVNADLRMAAQAIAEDVAPHVRLAVGMSRAPQAAALAGTVRTKRDRVPVVIVGKTNPRFKSGFHPNSNSARRRGSLAHGVIYGTAGGRRGMPRREDYYHIGRDDSGGPVGRTLTRGPAVRAAELAYLTAYCDILRAYGFDVSG